MSKTDHIPEFAIDANKRDIICSIGTANGMKRVSISASRARIVSQQIKAQANTYIDEGPIVLSWAMRWIANALDAELEKVANTKLQEVTDGKNVFRLVKTQGTAP